MSDQEIHVSLFTLHTLLFGVKLWAVWFAFSKLAFAQSNNKSFMVVFKAVNLALLLFCVAIATAEAWYLYSFFATIDLYYYEYISIVDQIVFTLIAVNYLIKEDT